MSNGEWVDENTIDTVCLECYKVTQKKMYLTCPICHGKTIYVHHGTAARAIEDIKARGFTDYGL